MSKLIGAVASILIGNYFLNAQSPALSFIEDIAHRSRSIVLLFIGSIILAILNASGVLLAILGAGSWWSALPGDLTAHAQFLFFAGIALIFVSTVGIFFTVSKIKTIESSRPQRHPLQGRLLTLVDSKRWENSR